MVYIYCLKDPQGNIRYIGKTTNLKRRLYSHIREAKESKSRRYVLNWIKSLLNKEEKPIIEIIEICTEDNWQNREKHWISFYRKIANLCNECDGGHGGTGYKNLSAAEREKKSLRMSSQFSRFSESIKRSIWSLIQSGNSLEEIQAIYPNYSRQMDFGIRNGRQWNAITGISKVTGTPKRKGYSRMKEYYIIRRVVDGKRKIIFLSKDESKVIEFLRNEKLGN